MKTIEIIEPQMPGSWTCPKCGFVLMKSTLYVKSGTVGADNSPFNETCPNDGTLMRPTTWREVNESLYNALVLERQRMNWLDDHCSFVADYPYVLGPFQRGELRKLADAGLKADETGEGKI